MYSFQKNNEQLNQMIDQGIPMEGFELFYDENVVMQENEEKPRIGKNANREQCGGFVKTFTDLKMKVLSVAYGENLSIQECHLTYTGTDGNLVDYIEVAVRHWKNDLIVKEKFYYSL